LLRALKVRSESLAYRENLNGSVIPCRMAS
jgi:hypothetical protein